METTRVSFKVTNTGQWTGRESSEWRGREDPGCPTVSNGTLGADRQTTL